MGFLVWEEISITVSPNSSYEKKKLLAHSCATMCVFYPGGLLSHDALNPVFRGFQVQN